MGVCLDILNFTSIVCHAITHALNITPTLCIAHRTLIISRQLYSGQSDQTQQFQLIYSNFILFFSTTSRSPLGHVILQW